MNLARLLAILVTSFALVSASAQFPASGPAKGAKGTTFGPDMTGIWFNPAESGWGVNVIQQSQTLFVTLFVYGTDGRALWFVGPDVSFASSDASGSTFAGTLFQTSGPYFGAGPFNSAAVSATPVGTLSMSFASHRSARMVYTVNGVTVTKDIVPQTFRNNNLAGIYVGYGAPPLDSPSCGLPLPPDSPLLVAFDVAHIGDSVNIRLQQNVSLAECSLVGTSTTYGKLVDVTGTYTCSSGTSGEFAITRLEMGIDGMSGVYTSLSDPFCRGAPVKIGGARLP